MNGRSFQVQPGFLEPLQKDEQSQDQCVSQAPLSHESQKKNASRKPAVEWWGWGQRLRNLSQRQTNDPALSKVQRSQNKTKPWDLQHHPHAEVIMDLLHSWGVELAVHLQTRHGGHRDLFSAASALADLHATFYVFFPVWFHLRRDAALRLLWVAVLGDWLNLVLKW